MILLTGASGYVGSHVRAILKQRSILAECSTDDMRWASTVEKLLLDSKPQVVIHCAAIVPKCLDDYADKAACENNQAMVSHLLRYAECPVVFASSQVAADPQSSRYALGKWICERWIQMRERKHDAILRLPGLFGLPRRSGVIYESAVKGEIRDSYGPHPAMHVQDAAEYLVRAATIPSDGDPAPYEVTYGNARLERVYGSLGVTFQQRVQELVEQVREVRA